MFGRHITVFEAFSFKVRIDASWLLLAVLITWGLAAGYFPALVPGLDRVAYWSMAIIGLVGLAGSIVLHELAHALVARRYDMPIHGITLFLFGGVAEMEDEPSSPRGEALMAVAGPAMSLALALVSGVMWLLLPHQHPLGGPFAAIFYYMGFVNGLLVAFNLLPAFPLDGGRVLRAALWAWRNDFTWATGVAGKAGTVLGLLLMAAGLYYVVTGNIVGGIWWVMIGFFIRAAAEASVREQQRQAVFAGERVHQFIEPHPITVPPDLPLDRLVEDYFQTYYLQTFPVTEEDRLLGRVCLERIQSLAPAERPGRTVRDVIEEVPGDAIVTEDTAATKAYRQMRRTGRHYLLVVSDNRLVGVLRMRSLQNALTIRRRLGRAANDDTHTTPRRIGRG